VIDVQRHFAFHPLKALRHERRGDVELARDVEFKAEFPIARGNGCCGHDEEVLQPQIVVLVDELAIPDEERPPRKASALRDEYPSAPCGTRASATTLKGRMRTSTAASLSMCVVLGQ